MFSLQYPWPETPPPGETIEVAPGIHWLSMPLPFQLDHINLWLLWDGAGSSVENERENEAGWTVVDTGIGDATTRALWEKLFEKFQPVLVPGFPVSYRRIIEGDTVRIGGHDWKAIIGHGHAPEHLSLYCEELNVVIAGDMLLSTISTNVSVWSIDPEGDPLRLFLESIARYRELPEDVSPPARQPPNLLCHGGSHRPPALSLLRRPGPPGHRRRRRDALR